MSGAREELLDRVVAHAAAHGLADSSLRVIADAIGTSHRMLLYHFGSREGLVAAIVERMEAQQREVLAQLGAVAHDPFEVITRQWTVLSAPEMAPFVRLFFEVVAQALFARPGTEGFLAGLTEPWIDTASEIARDHALDVDATDLRIGVAVVRGLLLDAVASGDTAAATAALHRFVQRWQAASPDAAPRGAAVKRRARPS
jgi:AcrR family transcriptional regulator